MPNPCCINCSDKKLNWNDVSQVRDRLILVLRLLQLCRSVDLSRIWRNMSQVGNEFYIKAQRKGALRPSWEQLVQLTPGQSDICPVTLVLTYVDLTKKHCPAGSLLFRSLSAPFHPLSANSIGRITRNLLQNLGVPPSWQPHSTRGAGVKMYKELGLTSEQVCEIGKWKNPNAFTAHYLRLGAVKSAAQCFISFGQGAQDSPGTWAEPDWSSTPGTTQDTGGIDQEGEAQEHGEPTLPAQEASSSSSVQKPSAVKRFFFAKPKTSQDPPPTQGPDRKTKSIIEAPSTASPQAVRTARRHATPKNNAHRPRQKQDLTRNLE